LRVRPAEPARRTINLDVVVTTKDGKPISGLEQKDFSVLDNKVPEKITSFRADDGTQEPVEVILLVDSLNTGFQVVAQERTEIDRFLRANGGKLAHPRTLALLSSAGVQMQKTYSQDGNHLADSLDKSTIGLRAIGRAAGAEGDAERMEDSLKALRTLITYES
jgi:VWFA-related protein